MNRVFFGVALTWAVMSAWARPSPLNDLGAGTYLGFQGGLYPGGVNTPPPAHASAALAQAAQIVPRRADGTPDPVNGLIVMIAIGMSNTTQEFGSFERLEDPSAYRNPRVVIVNTAVGGQTAAAIANPAAQYWTVVNQRLTALGLTPAQVQVAWMKEADANPTAAFPVHAQTLVTEFTQIANNLVAKFPNIKLCYNSSRIYGGYASTTLNPEPYAYESGFAVKWFIESQINGDPNLNWNPANGPVLAPLLLWGPYLWAEGLTPRSDGLTWASNEFQSDGTHPNPLAEAKVGGMIASFLYSDPSAAGWWKHAADPGVNLATVEAAADATVSAASPNTNAGSALDLRGDGGANPVLNAYLKFDASAPGMRPFLHAKLSLRAWESAQAGGVLRAVADTAWNEAAITFNTAPAVGAIVAQVPNSSDSTIAASVGPNLAADADGVVSYMLTSGSPTRYPSRESGPAFGGTAASPRLVLVVPAPFPGDLNADGHVTTADLLLLLGHFGLRVPPGTLGTGDINADGVVNTADLLVLLGNFGV